MLKRFKSRRGYFYLSQPPSGGCVLKPSAATPGKAWAKQPPSGGCVLKQELAEKVEKLENSRLRAAVC